MEYKGRSLDDAIKHEMAVVENATAIKLRTENHSGTKVTDAYDENIEYHKQLVKWLKELKGMRKNASNNKR